MASKTSGRFSHVCRCPPMFEFKELIPILRFSSFPSILTSRYIVTIAGKPRLATNCIKSSSIDIFLQIIFYIHLEILSNIAVALDDDLTDRLKDSTSAEEILEAFAG